MKLSAEALMTIANEIRQSPIPRDRKKDAFTEKYPDFAASYPQLLEMCTDPTADFAQLAYLLGQMKAVEDRAVTFEQASVQVGQVFADRYVTPIVDRLDAEKAAKKRKNGD